MQRWGPSTWNFFHTLADKIKDEAYEKHFPILWKHLVKICNSLPCPQCSEHAGDYIRGFRHTQFKNKQVFKQFIFQFHNEVNARTKKQPAPFDILSKYESERLSDAFNSFFLSWNDVNNRSNITLLAHSFSRKKTIHDFHIWFYSNLDIFDMT